MHPTLAARLPPRTRLFLYAGTLLVSAFTLIYARLVCSYMCSLSIAELAQSVALLAALHVGLREALLRTAKDGGGPVSPARKVV